MNYNELKEIVRHLKKIVPCTSCKRKFNNESINVLSSFNNEALFHFKCPHCSNQLMVHVSVNDSTPGKLNIQTKRNPGSVSTNDVLDVHNFLSQFQGDFKQLLQ